MTIRNVLVPVAVLGTLCALVNHADAVEDGAGFYLLGGKTNMSGYIPPPGTYVSNINYYYNGDASGQAAVGRALRDLGRITVEANVGLVGEAFLEAPYITWVAPEKVLGGNVALGVIIPYGWKKADIDLDVRAALTLRNGTTLQANRQFEIEDDIWAFGDPVPTVAIGWHEGNWHWNLGSFINVPIGQYDADNISNMGFNHWGIDITPAVTYLNPTNGVEVSVAAGFTFNWENPDTNYESGTEFHVEWALIQHLSKTLSLGLVGYHYDQVTGDSGAGATLGDFKGRVSALGANIQNTFAFGKVPLIADLKYFHEFEAVNRAEGDVGMVTLTIPVSVPGQ